MMSDSEDSKGLLDGYITRAALAAALGVNTRTICRYEGQPDGLPATVIGGRKFYRLESVRRWIDSRERHPNKRREGRHARSV